MIVQIPAAVALSSEPAAPSRPDAPADGAGQAFEQAMQDDAAAPRHERDRKADDPAPRPAGMKPRKRADKPARDDPDPAGEPTGQANPQTTPAPDPRAEALAPLVGPKTEPLHALAALPAVTGTKRAAVPLQVTQDSPLVEGEAAALPAAPAPVRPAAAPTAAILSPAPEALRAAARALAPLATSRARSASDAEAPPEVPADAPAMPVDLRAADPPAPAARPAWSQAASVLMWQAGGAAAQGPVDAPPTEAAVAAMPVVESPKGEAMTTTPAEAAHEAIRIDTAAAPSAQPSAQATAPAIPAQPLPGPAPAEPAVLPRPFHPMIAAIAAQAAHPVVSKPAGAATELILHPAELGRIRFSLSGAGDQLTIAINAENPETLALLQRHVPALQAELQREGLGQANLAFSGWGGDGAARQDTPSSAPPGFWSDAETESPALLPPDARPAPRPGGGLDLRL